MNILTRFLPWFAAAGLSLAAVSAAPEQAHADGIFSCIPIEVTEFSDRIHVACSNNANAQTGANVIYLAILKTDTARAARYLSIANAALLSRRFFYVFVTTSSATNVPGCGATDCRTPAWFGVRDR